MFFIYVFLITRAVLVVIFEVALFSLFSLRPEKGTSIQGGICQQKITCPLKMDPFKIQLHHFSGAS